MKRIESRLAKLETSGQAVTVDPVMVAKADARIDAWFASLELPVSSSSNQADCPDGYLRETSSEWQKQFDTAFDNFKKDYDNERYSEEVFALLKARDKAWKNGGPMP